MNCKDCQQDCQRIGCDIELECTGYVGKAERIDFCKTCVYYPPSSCDGKPCTQCHPENPLLNCRIEKEAESEGE